MTLLPGNARRDRWAVGDIIHRPAAFGGEDIESVYASVVFRNRQCSACASPKPVIRIQTFVAISDIPNVTISEAVRLMVQTGDFIPVPLKDGPGIRTGEIFACSACQLEAERAAARGPSFAVVVFDRLPHADGLIVQVTR